MNDFFDIYWPKPKLPESALFDKSWRDVSIIAPAERYEVDELIKRHYLGCWPGVCMLILALKIEAVAFGAIVFSMPPRETKARYGGETWELARLWIDDCIPKNAETWMIGKSIRYIRRHCQSIKALVSYADPSAGHTGIIYRAANWLADGRTDQERKSPRVDYADASGKKYSRRGHVPEGAEIIRVPRVSKYRFVYRIKN